MLLRRNSTQLAQRWNAIKRKIQRAHYAGLDETTKALAMELILSAPRASSPPVRAIPHLHVVVAALRSDASLGFAADHLSLSGGTSGRHHHEKKKKTTTTTTTTTTTSNHQKRRRRSQREEGQSSPSARPSRLDPPACSTDPPRPPDGNFYE
jgi:hypothetical protein